MVEDFDPVNTFNILLKAWWKIVLLALVGGSLGLIASFFLPPIFQAEAVFHASIDFTEINFENLIDQNEELLVFTQYDEDLAVQVVQRMFLKTMGEAFEKAQSLDPSIDLSTFLRNYQIQRYHALWFLRYRHKDPQIAQTIVNTWAENSLAALRDAQATGEAEAFVIADLVSEAVLPPNPLYHNRNTLVLAGTLIGFVAAILVVDVNRRYLKPPVKEA